MKWVFVVSIALFFALFMSTFASATCQTDCEASSLDWCGLPTCGCADTTATGFCPSSGTNCAWEVGPSPYDCHYGGSCVAGATCGCVYTNTDSEKPCIEADCTSSGWDDTDCDGTGSCSNSNNCASVALGATCTQNVHCTPYCDQITNCGCLSAAPGDLLGDSCAGGTGTLTGGSLTYEYDEVETELCPGPGGGSQLSYYERRYEFTCTPTCAPPKSDFYIKIASYPTWSPINTGTIEHACCDSNQCISLSNTCQNQGTNTRVGDIDYVCNSPDNAWYPCNSGKCNVPMGGKYCVRIAAGAGDDKWGWRSTATSTEICNDGFDNDCNGLVDCADPDCASVCDPDSVQSLCSAISGTFWSTSTSRFEDEAGSQQMNCCKDNDNAVGHNDLNKEYPLLKKYETTGDSTVDSIGSTSSCCNANSDCVQEGGTCRAQNELFTATNQWICGASNIVYECNADSICKPTLATKRSVNNYECYKESTDYKWKLTHSESGSIECVDSVNNDCDTVGYFDYDTLNRGGGAATHGDDGCTVGIDDCLGDGGTVTQNNAFLVECDATVADVNSITATPSSGSCTSTDTWNGDKAEFTCTFTGTGAQSVTCDVDTSKSYAGTIINNVCSWPNVLSDSCGSYSDQASCDGDPACTWFPVCEGGVGPKTRSDLGSTGICLSDPPGASYVCEEASCGAACDVSTAIANGWCDIADCSRHCDSGYYLSGSSCLPYTCTGAVPSVTGAVMCTNDDTGLASNLAWLFQSGGCTPGRKCEYACPAGEFYNASSNACEVIVGSFSCTGAVPSVAGSVMCTNDNTDLTSDLPWLFQPGSCTARKCEYNCSSGLVYNASSGVCEMSGGGPVCGDGTCDASEVCTCAADSGVKSPDCPAHCGNDVCDCGETPLSCAADCVTFCGDGSKQNPNTAGTGGPLNNGDEDCDGSDVGVADCTTVPGGFIGGSLACDANCVFDTSGCTNPLTTGNLSGWVNSSTTEEGIPGARVSVVAPPDGFLAVSDGDGNYTLENIPSGWRFVSASKRGYRSVTAAFFIDAIDDNVLNFNLSDGDCEACADWENRCDPACAGTGLCTQTDIPAICAGAKPGDWVLNETGDGHVQCCTGEYNKPRPLGQASVTCPTGKHLVKHTNILSYGSILASMEVFVCRPEQ